MIQFDPVIWGTVSDWLMILVTAITAVFLYMTLKSQKEVQQTQNELYKIETIRFKESIKPELSYSIGKEQIQLGESDHKMLTIELSNETNNIALNISRFVETSKYTPQMVTVTGYGDRRDHLMKGDQPIRFFFKIDPNDRSSQLFTFEIKYEDVAGTKYQQAVFCVCDKYGTEIHPSLPEIVKEKV